METENQKPKNPSAFPLLDPKSTFYNEGMTLRDYFAAKAMQAIYSNPDWMKEYKGDKYLMKSRIAAEVSYDISDAMLKQREL